MATAAVAAAISLKEAMDRFGLKGTIKVFGSPGEEIVASRPYMIRAGLFEGVDAVIDNHSSSGFGTEYGVGGNALFSTIFSFKGKTAHAAGAPWVGRSALDAVEIMNVSTNFLREHLPLSHRLHYVILEGGEAPNVVPDKASVWYYVRNTDERLEEMYQKVVNCAKAGALAAGVELSSMRVISAIHQRHANKAAAELIQKNIKEYKLNRIVVASCSPLLHEHTFRGATEAGGLNPFFFHMVNIREHDSWVHTDRQEATDKAKALATRTPIFLSLSRSRRSMFRLAMARSSRLSPLPGSSMIPSWMTRP